MFTGLIAELGKITAIDKGESSAVFTIAAPSLISQIALGDSVAINGVCLTATSISGDTFTADVMVQTLAVTSLSQTAVGGAVNLELAALLNTRMGGHLVQGHVDGVATVVAITPGEKWTQLDITVPEKLAKYIVNQGSICLDGVSLTVGEINDSNNVVTVWLIPETLERTNLSTKKSGDLINIEVDVLAKYVERLLARGEKK
ncbi:MAG: riboflavin synthase subunit alpha [Actinobacteria bacterium BACL15 MAG-120619-bin91]|jgi:riboflavin synthase|uniref:Riboflavin synthase n=1 Tax=Actinobacteria bacterium BACL15 MAG-120619-bin91 TaxID=1655562 RepID=A0A0R2PE47_9ACTN|nr:MAG: riboflavin synthase subunit alpha [Actinobacteria bacterium BACL15 MAG-120619-bin91]